MKRSKLKPGARKKLRWIKRLAIIAGVLGAVVLFSNALRTEYTAGSILSVIVSALVVATAINVTEAANELLTGYIYGGEEE